MSNHATMRAARPGTMVGVVKCLSPAVLRHAAGPSVGLALWRRPTKASLQGATSALLAMPPFSRIAQGSPVSAVREMLRELPYAARPLGGDIGMLASLFADITGETDVRLRLEHVDDDACRCHHVDAVRLRLLCTYVGAGTEWLDTDGGTHRMPAMNVGMFKGSDYPDAAPRVLHRSPPVSHLSPRRRHRLLLCIDQPGVF